MEQKYFKAIILALLAIHFYGFCTGYANNIEDVYNVSEEMKLLPYGIQSGEISIPMVENDNAYVFITERTFPESTINKFLFVDITSDGVKTCKEIEAPEEYKSSRPPDLVFNNEQQSIVFIDTRIGSIKKGNDCEIKFFEPEKENNELTLINKIELSGLNKLIGKYAHIESVISFDKKNERVLVIGDYIYTGHRLTDIITWHKQEFTKNFSLTIENGEVKLLQKIEEKGRYDAENPIYSASKSGIMHCVWKRYFKNKAFIMYSANYMDGSGWLKPIELYGAEFTEEFINSMSIACNEETAYVLWGNDKNELYLAEIRKGTIKNKKMLDQIVEGLNDNDYSAKMAVDNAGNLFILISNKTPLGHELILHYRNGNVWQGPLLITNRNENAIQPDMKIGGNGILHIVYGKGVNSGSGTYSYDFVYRRFTPVFMNYDN